jgi:hypothetical protein
MYYKRVMSCALAWLMGLAHAQPVMWHHVGVSHVGSSGATAESRRLLWRDWPTCPPVTPEQMTWLSRISPVGTSGPKFNRRATFHPHLFSLSILSLFLITDGRFHRHYAIVATGCLARPAVRRQTRSSSSPNVAPSFELCRFSSK